MILAILDPFSDVENHVTFCQTVPYNIGKVSLDPVTVVLAIGCYFPSILVKTVNFSEKQGILDQPRYLKTECYPIGISVKPCQI